MYNFCTLFDSNYLAKGLCLYDSLEKNCENFHLFIFAFDEKCRIYLENKKLAHATIIGLKEFEDTELLKVKHTRSVAEYCWTSTSSTILYCLNNYNIDSCTYLDSDLYFFSSPEIIFKEIGEASISFTKHNYHFLYNQAKTNGEYCVQFMYFRNTPNAIEALKWWRDKCLDWCYNYLQDGKFGDQGYLSELIEKFDNIHIIKNEGAGMAPWNLLKYKRINECQNSYVIKRTDEKFDLIFYHFHYFHYKIIESAIRAKPGKMLFTNDILQNCYLPYLQKIFKFEKDIQNLNCEITDKMNVYLVRTSIIIKIVTIIRVFMKRNEFIRRIYNSKKNSGKK